MMRFPFALVILSAVIGFAAPAFAQEGACCLPPCNVCQIMTQAACEQQGGQYLGDGTVCDPLP